MVVVKYAWLLLGRYEFEPHNTLLKIVVEKDENKQKDAMVNPFEQFDDKCQKSF